MRQAVKASRGRVCRKEVVSNNNSLPLLPPPFPSTRPKVDRVNLSGHRPTENHANDKSQRRGKTRQGLKPSRRLMWFTDEVKMISDWSRRIPTYETNNDRLEVYRSIKRSENQGLTITVSRNRRAQE